MQEEAIRASMVTALAEYLEQHSGLNAESHVKENKALVVQVPRDMSKHDFVQKINAACGLGMHYAHSRGTETADIIRIYGPSWQTLYKNLSKEVDSYMQERRRKQPAPQRSLKSSLSSNASEVKLPEAPPQPDTPKYTPPPQVASPKLSPAALMAKFTQLNKANGEKRRRLDEERAAISQQSYTLLEQSLARAEEERERLEKEETKLKMKAERINKGEIVIISDDEHTEGEQAQRVAPR